MKRQIPRIKTWTLETTGWKLFGGDPKLTYDVSKLDEKKDAEKIFYKSRWIKEDGLEQHLIVTYSLKYRDYLRTIRKRQLERALKAVKKGAFGVESKRQNDPKRFIKADHATKDGEVADNPVYLHDKERIKAHFMTCFIALIVYRYLEKKLDEKYTCSQILDCLQEMEFLKFEGKGYVPTYTKNEFTDDLHNALNTLCHTELAISTCFWWLRVVAVR